MVALYLALVLASIICGVVIGFAAPQSLFIDSELDAQCWASEVMNNTACGADMGAFNALVERLANKTVFVDWAAVLTPPLDAFKRDALRLMGACQIASERGVVLDVSDDMATPCYTPSPSPVQSVGLPRVFECAPGSWVVDWQGVQRMYTRRDNAQRGAARMVRRFIERGEHYALYEV
jgi:hypothetical protein